MERSIIQEIHDLVADGHVKEAINRFRVITLGNDDAHMQATLLSLQWRQLQRDGHNLSRELYNRHENEVAVKLLELLKDFSKGRF